MPTPSPGLHALPSPPILQSPEPMPHTSPPSSTCHQIRRQPRQVAFPQHQSVPRLVGEHVLRELRAELCQLLHNLCVPSDGAAETHDEAWLMGRGVKPAGDCRPKPTSARTIPNYNYTTETNAHGDALCFMVKIQNHRNSIEQCLAVGGGWRLVVIGGCPSAKKHGGS